MAKMILIFFAANDCSNGENTMVPKSYAGMYSSLLVSPWACSLEDEQKVSSLD
jgi:hypothetical protein